MEQKMNKKNANEQGTKNILTKIALAVLIMFSFSSHATLINGDFNNGFVGWEGEVAVFDNFTGGDDLFFGDITGSYPDSFLVDATLGQATVQTGSFGDLDYYSVAFYQDFTMNTIAAGSSLWLSLDVAFNLTDDTVDFAYAQLIDTVTNDSLNLLSGGSFNITSWAGKQVALEFGVADDDFVLGDTLSAANINITEHPTEVPEPSTLLIFGLGLFVLKRNSFQFK